jgi:hypothetical protein
MNGNLPAARGSPIPSIGLHVASSVFWTHSLRTYELPDNVEPLITDTLINEHLQ